MFGSRKMVASKQEGVGDQREREIATRCARETTSSLATQQRRPGEIGLSTSLGEHVSVTRVPSQLRAGCTWKRSCTCRIGGSRGSAKLASTCYQSYIKLDHSAAQRFSTPLLPSIVVTLLNPADLFTVKR